MDDDLFRMISEAAFSNPFSDRRAVIGRQIVQGETGDEWNDLLLPLLNKLEQNIQELSASGEPWRNLRSALRIRKLDDRSRAIGVSLLFHTYHRFMEQFDALIIDQIKSGDTPCRAAFAYDCMQQLMEYGFSQTDACRFVAMFFQIRRAYFLISKELVGASPSMKHLRAQLWDNIFTHDIEWYERCLWNRMEDFSTLLLGETGTGKGAAAAAIGRSGFIPYNPNTQKFEESFTRAFVSINLSQYPESLIESELFGHCKGAFTGAIEKHDGVFSLCSPHGAIFIDEIGDVSVPVQIKLLQVLQDRTFAPVGRHDKHRFQGRVIAATNKSVDALRHDGRFREDFYYRLCTDIITVPPLRQRIREMPSELEILTTHLIRRICGPDLQVPVIDKLKESLDKNYAWPGNVRELEQAIRRIIITGTYEGDTFIETADQRTLNTAATETGMTAKELVRNYCRTLYKTYENYGEVARRTGLDWRTVKKNVAGDD